MMIGALKLKITVFVQVLPFATNGILTTLTISNPHAGIKDDDR